MSVGEGAWDLISGELGLQSDLLFLSLGHHTMGGLVAGRIVAS